MTPAPLPLTFVFAAALALAAAVYGLAHLRRSWAPPFLAVVGTFAAWYLVEPLVSPEAWAGFEPDHVGTAYGAATLFLLAFIAAFFALRPAFVPSVRARRSIRDTMTAPGSIPPDRIALLAVAVWLVLLAYGTARVGGDLIQALFPVESRAGLKMWQRHPGMRAGPAGFLVSMAGYLYTLVLALFGILLPIVRKPSTRALLVLVILIAWPYAFLQGSRNVALAVAAPMFASMFLFTRIRPAVKLAVMAAGFLALDFAFRAIIAMRNTGFDVERLQALAGQRHLGLNMGSELIWIVTLFERRMVEPSWGGRYFAELVAVIPRAIWPGKPLIGIDYALARGYGGGGSDIGVFATISTGMIGQGAVNFGLVLGPLTAALLLAVWANLLHRLRLQGTAPRVALFLLGLGLTFNLGRDVTLLVLFPFLFGYLAVRLSEALATHPRGGRRMRRSRSPRHAPPPPRRPASGRATAQPGRTRTPPVPPRLDSGYGRSR